MSLVGTRPPTLDEVENMRENNGVASVSSRELQECGR